MSNDEILREFLLETHENLALLDADLLRLEQQPTDAATLAQAFRTLHSVKGTAGFMGLDKLQAISHSAESLLAKLRSGTLLFNRPIATALLKVVDAIREILAQLEVDGTEGSGEYAAISAEVDLLQTGQAPDPNRTEPDLDVAGAITALDPHRTRTSIGELTLPFLPPITPAAPSHETIAYERPERSVKHDELATAKAAVEPAGVHPTSVHPTSVHPTSDHPTSDHPTSDHPTSDHPTDAPPTSAVPASVLPTSAALASTVADTSIRVDVDLVDQLMTLVGELVLARNHILQVSAGMEHDGLTNAVQRLSRLTTDLQSSVMKTRMQPIANVLNKFPRIVRDLSLAVGKKVQFDVGGHDTELDRSLLEAIRDPLTHMIRNAIDHGIEDPATRIAAGKSAEGHLQLRAHHEGGKVVIEIQDDGRGVNIERVREKALSQGLITAEVAARMNHNELLKLIFLPGFSTTDKVTQFSGRGVGMDVVRTNIERIGGTVDIESQLGQGTTVRTKIPLTLAIIPALVIHHGGERYAIPQVNLLELVRLSPDQVRMSVSRIQETPVYRLRGSLLPLLFLDEQLQEGSSRTVDRDWNIVIVQADDRPFGIVVDSIRDTEEIVVKPLQKQVKALAPFAGATIMGDGRVALVLDVMALAQRAGVLSRDVMRARSRSEENDEAAVQVDAPPLLICETRRGDRVALVLQQVARLEKFQVRDLERMGERLVVQYRDAILPLVDVSSEVAGEPPLDVSQSTAEIPVIVFAAGSQPVGLIVGQIVDIVAEAQGTCLPSSRPGVLYSAVIMGRVTEFLDAIELVQSSLNRSLSRGRMNPLLQPPSLKSSGLT
jgi:two-component system chemotaxis sensor kinase CheA